ncbi:hypothetical protein LOZ65_003964, partial [Ophidiomyces ophidiicola]
PRERRQPHAQGRPRRRRLPRHHPHAGRVRPPAARAAQRVRRRLGEAARRDPPPDRERRRAADEGPRGRQGCRFALSDGQCGRGRQRDQARPRDCREYGGRGCRHAASGQHLSGRREQAV